METVDRKNFFKRLNDKIAKLNKTTMILILAAYALVLGLLYTVVSRSKTYITIPNYSHVYFNENINPQISIIAIRNFDDDGNEKLKYTVSVSIYGRINESSTSDPGYAINEFKMSATTTEELNSIDVDSMYYFTEQSSYSTPTTHSYTIDNSTIKQHPLGFYTLLEYKKAGVSYIDTFKEDVFLQPLASEKALMDAYYDANKDVENTSINITDKEGNKIGNLQIVARDGDNEYLGSLKITMDTLNYQSRHHIDMQTWVETQGGEYLPYVGVYGYSSQKSNYTQNGRSISKNINPKYVCAKLVYYFGPDDYKEFYFKQDITKLGQAFSSNPLVGDGDNEVPEKNNTWKYVLIGAAIGVVAAVAVVGTVVLVIKKKESK